MQLTSTEVVSLRRPLKERVRRNFQRLWASGYMRYGAAILIALTLMAVFADVLATHEATRLNPAERLQSPSGSHFFGTDNLGRDVYSQTLAGARLSLFIGATVVAISIPQGRRRHHADSGRTERVPFAGVRAGADGRSRGERCQRHHRAHGDLSAEDGTHSARFDAGDKRADVHRR